MCDCGHEFEADGRPRRGRKSYQGVSQDLFSFLLPFGYASTWSAEWDASVPRLIGLVITNVAVMIVGLLFLVSTNPYIAFGSDLLYLPFDLAWLLLILVSFFLLATVHFVCFRLASGIGNLIPHAYASALSSTALILLYYLAVLALLISRSWGIDELILKLGGLYLLYPTVRSLKVVHHISTTEAIVGFVLSVIASFPLLTLYLHVFGVIAEASPGEFFTWQVGAYLSGVALVGVVVLAYVLEQQAMAHLYDRGVPISKPLKTAFQKKWVRIALPVLVVCLLGTSILNALGS